MSEVKVLIKNGQYRDVNSRVIEVKNELFDLVEGLRSGTKGQYVTVDGKALTGKDKVRVKVVGENDVQYQDVTGNTVNITPAGKIAKNDVDMTDAEIIQRTEQRFDIMLEIATAVAEGHAGSLVLSGPPGVGKTYELNRHLAPYDPYTIGGTTSGIGLYGALVERADAGCLTILDDTDKAMRDEECLNILKNALDTKKKRTISWNKQTDWPSPVTFQGGIIFVSNNRLTDIMTPKNENHIKAIISRAYCVDIGLHTNREALLWIDKKIGEGMLAEFDFDEEGDQEVLDYLHHNQNDVAELSLRMAHKVAKLRHIYPNNWAMIADNTCFKLEG